MLDCETGNQVESGRWLSPDPLGGDISNPQSLNRYAYALNNPTTFTDLSGRGIIMDMAYVVIHISEAEAASDFASLLARVRAGAEVVIERDSQPVAVVHPAPPLRRTISECIALARVHEEETGQAPVLDPDFAADLEEVLNRRQPWNPPTWE